MIVQTLSVKEAADVFKVRPKTVRRWIAEGNIPASKIGRGYIIPMEAVETKMKHARVVPTGAAGANEKRVPPEDVRMAEVKKLFAVFRGVNIDKEAIRREWEEDVRLEEAADRKCGL